MNDILEVLVERFASAGDRRAFVDRGRTVTYAELTEAIETAAGWLAETAISRGEVVVVLGDYSPDVVALIVALLRNGNVIVPVTGEALVELGTVLGLSEAGRIVDTRRGAPSVEATGVLPTHPLLTGLVERGAPGLILFSSGSSGRPKGILHDMAAVLEKFRAPGPPITAIAFLMLDHFGGINTIFSILGGLGTVVTVEDRSVHAICRAIEAHRVEVLPTTPSFLNLLIRSDATRRHDLSSLRKITYGTEVMPQETLDRVRAAFPDVVLQQTYGLSELGVLRSRSREDGSLWVRIGGEGFETKIVDGILWIRSRYAMVGYLNAPDAFDADGWFNTQDRVEVDGDWFRILGRDSDLINVAGQKVYPAEVEQAILALPNVRDVAVFGEPHPLLGNVVVARVVTETPESAPELKVRIRTACAASLAAFKLPTKVLLADASELYSVRLKKRRRA
jgi:acyl-CoA synthetase (AMP-forming)/AMP-acid ligase II